MTVSTTGTVAESLCNGVTTSFPVPFQYAAPSDLVVELIDAAGDVIVLSEGAHYFRVGNGMSAPSTVTTLIAYPAGTKLRRRRDTSLSQSLDLVPNVGAPAEAQELALDRVVLAQQEQQALNRDVAGRAIMLPEGETAAPLPPAGAARRDTVVTFDSLTGESIVLRKAGSFPPGPPGGAGNVVKSIGQLRAEPISSGTMIAQYDGTGSSMTWTEGNFVARAMQRPADFVESDFYPLTIGAWVRQSAESIVSEKAPSVVRSQQDQNRDGWSVYDFFKSYNRRQLSRDFSESAAAECTLDVNAALASGEYIRAPAGLLLTEGALVGGDRLKFTGAGAGRSIIKKPPGSTTHLLDLIGTTVKRNVHIDGFTMDVNGGDAGIVMEYVEDSLFQNLKILNNPYWGINMGALDAGSGTIVNKRNTFRNLFFNNTTLSYEHFLIFRSEDILIDRLYASTGADGIGIGIYENSDRITIQHALIEMIKTAIYYSLSCRAIKILDSVIRGTDSGIQGANLADNGAFGSRYAENLEIHRTRFFGNRDCGLSMGALFRATIRDCEFENNQGPGVLFNQGGIGVSGTPALERRANKVLLDGCTFRNNNAAGLPAINGAGVVFTGTGGDMDVEIRDCHAFDDRAQPKQIYPIAFVGAHDWQNVRVTGGSLQSYGGGQTVGKTADATIDVEVSAVRQLSTTVAAGVSGASYVATQTYDPPSLASGAKSAPITVTVQGARAGDVCTVAFDKIVGEVVVDGAIVSDNTAIVYFMNRSGATVDMQSGSLVVTSYRPRKVA